MRYRAMMSAGEAGETRMQRAIRDEVIARRLR